MDIIALFVNSCIDALGSLLKTKCLLGIRKKRKGIRSSKARFQRDIGNLIFFPPFSISQVGLKERKKKKKKKNTSQS